VPSGNPAKRAKGELSGDARQQAIAKRLENAAKPRRLKPRCCPKPFKAKPKPEGYTFGRPTLYRPEYCQSVIDLMGKGYDLTAFAGYIGVDRNAIYEWMVRHNDFGDAVRIARNKRSFALQEKLLTTKQGVGVTAAIFALKNAEPEDWQDRYNTQTEVTLRIEKLSDAQLQEIAARGMKTIEHKP
jgi:hypothetical protein